MSSVNSGPSGVGAKTGNMLLSPVGGPGGTGPGSSGALGSVRSNGSHGGGGGTTAGGGATAASSEATSPRPDGSPGMNRVWSGRRPGSGMVNGLHVGVPQGSVAGGGGGGVQPPGRQAGGMPGAGLGPGPPLPAIGGWGQGRNLTSRG